MSEIELPITRKMVEKLYDDQTIFRQEFLENIKDPTRLAVLLINYQNDLASSVASAVATLEARVLELEDNTGFPIKPDFGEVNVQLTRFDLPEAK